MSSKIVLAVVAKNGNCVYRWMRSEGRPYVIYPTSDLHAVLQDFAIRKNPTPSVINLDKAKLPPVAEPGKATAYIPIFPTQAQVTKLELVNLGEFVHENTAYSLCLAICDGLSLLSRKGVRFDSQYVYAFDPNPDEFIKQIIQRGIPLGYPLA